MNPRAEILRCTDMTANGMTEVVKHLGQIVERPVPYRGVTARGLSEATGISQRHTRRICEELTSEGCIRRESETLPSGLPSYHYFAR